MSAPIRQAILAATDNFLSLRSTRLDHEHALESLETLVAGLALQGKAPPRGGQQQDAAAAGPASSDLDKFLTLQDGFEYNITCTLLEWSTRLIQTMERGHSAEEQETTQRHLIRALSLIQGSLLIHRASQKLFGRRSAVECLLTILAATRPASLLSPSPSMPSSTHPSPVMLPPSPSPSVASTSSSTSSTPSASTTTSTLALVALDTILCALVDRPKNLRNFEACGGLGVIVKVLKDKSVRQEVRIKAIEILYYYLLPETPSLSRSTSTASTSYSPSLSPTPSTPSKPKPLASKRSPLSSSARTSLLPISNTSIVEDFVPQTPMKPRSARPPPPPASRSPNKGHRRAQSTSALSLYASTSSSSPFTPHHHLLSSKSDKENDASSATPKASPRTSITPTPASPHRTPRSSRPAHASRSPAQPPPSSSHPPPDLNFQASTPQTAGKAHHRRALSSTPSFDELEAGLTRGLLFPAGRGPARERKTRTTEEKRELLRVVMPNVEQLEARFEAMGLGGW